MIELKQITRIFKHKESVTTALNNVSITVSKGKIMGIIGKSGAGKSTLIRCANLLERPDSGEVRINGVNLMELSSAELTKARRNIGMIFQHFNLLSSRTVFENVAFPLELDNTPKAEIEKRVLDLLKLVGLEHKSDEYPAKLSGGQKQRVAIARTLARNPDILLCDEATSALDPVTTRSILSLLRDINKEFNITILLITHEMDVVKEVCDEVAVLDNGQLIEQGSIAEIFMHPKHELTSHFVSSSLHIKIPLDYQGRLSTEFVEGKHLLITLEISGQSFADAALSQAARLFHTNSNIICAQMDYVGGVKFGIMLLELIGNKSKELKVVDFLKRKRINVKILGYV